MCKDRSFRQTARRGLDESVRAARSIAGRAGGSTLAAYDRLVRHVRGVSSLLRPSARSGGGGCRVNAALLSVARHHADWSRPAEGWVPPPGPVWPQFTSLAHHLFARYPVPAFMTSVWFAMPPGEALPEHGWYKHLARGANIRTAGVPLRLTRAAAHLFTQAPDHLPAAAALRWAQARGFGCDKPLARALAASRLGREFGGEDFWETVVAFLGRHTSFPPGQVGPLAECLHHLKFEGRDGVTADGVAGRLPPPRPDFEMKGRTVASLLRLIDDWHRELGRRTGPRALSWGRCRVGEFRRVEGDALLGDMRVWTVTELLTDRELLLEGRAQRHCVAIYAAACARGVRSIWSVRVETRHGTRRVLTVEIDPATMTIRQARGKFNRRAGGAGRSVLELWAAREGLRLAE